MFESEVTFSVTVKASGLGYVKFPDVSLGEPGFTWE